MSRFRRASTETHPPVTRRAYCFGGFDPGGVASVDLVALPCASVRHVTARIIPGPILLRLPRRRDQLQPVPIRRLIVGRGRPCRSSTLGHASWYLSPNSWSTKPAW